MTEDHADAKPSRASPVGKMPVELKTYVPYEVAEQAKAKFASLGQKTSDGMRDLLWQFLFGETFSEVELREMAHVVERRKNATAAKGIVAGDAQAKPAIAITVVGEVSAK
jgi:hypothetical protein